MTIKSTFLAVISGMLAGLVAVTVASTLSGFSIADTRELDGGYRDVLALGYAFGTAFVSCLYGAIAFVATRAIKTISRDRTVILAAVGFLSLALGNGLTEVANYVAAYSDNVSWIAFQFIYMFVLTGVAAFFNASLPRITFRTRHQPATT